MIHKYNDASKLSAHFSAREFRCKCSKQHDYITDNILVAKLETLFNILGCDKIIITSGYRCPTHDKTVGGTGSGRHVQGSAADIMCYRGGKVLSSKIVCCAAQDVGFNGIANINKVNTATHVDMADRKWKGDETITTSKSITDDFYKYYNLTKSDVYPNGPTSTKAKIKVTMEFDDHRYCGLLEEE